MAMNRRKHKKQDQKSSDSLNDHSTRNQDSEKQRHKESPDKKRKDIYEIKKKDRTRELNTIDNRNLETEEYKVYTLPTNKFRDLPPEPRDVKELPTAAAVERKRRSMPQYCKIILLPMFSAMSKITDNLYLTSIGGMTQENFEKYNIRCIINATFEAPNLRKKGIESVRVPVDDSPNDDIQEFFDPVADKINERTQEKINIVVHCIAGVSRSTSLVLAYLMKYHKMDLHSAFSYIHSKRPVVRPNNGFFVQLLNYEMKLFGKNSFKMVQIYVNDVKILVPDFFQTEHRGFIILESLKEKSKLESRQKKKEKPSTSQDLSTSDKKSNQPDDQPTQQQIDNEDKKKESILKRFIVDKEASTSLKSDNERSNDQSEEKSDKKNKKDKNK